MHSCSLLVADCTRLVQRRFQSNSAFISQYCSPSCPFTQSMDYLSNVLTSGLQLSKPIDAPKAGQNVAVLEEMPGFSAPNSLIQEPNSDLRGSTTHQHPQTRRKSSAKSRTIFTFAHPPPKSKYQQRFHIGPKVLLQLQQISQVSRPKPFIDVLQSSSHFSLSSMRFSRHAKGKPSHLGPDDLIIVHSPSYDEIDARNSRGLKHHVKSSQDVIAYVCRRKEGLSQEHNAYIRMSGGYSWTGHRLSSGNYELINEDEHSQRMVVRWVRKQRPPVQQERQIRSDLPAEDRQKGTTFTFSIINPNARRHAIIASLDSSGINICDKYSTSPASTPPSNQSSRSATTRSSFPFDDQEASQEILQTMSEELRTLIAISGSWVAISEGYSPHIKPDQGQGIELSRRASKADKHRSLPIDLVRSLSKSSKACELPRDPIFTPPNPMFHANSTSRIPLTRRQSKTRTERQRVLSMGAIPT